MCWDVLSILLLMWQWGGTWTRDNDLSSSKQSFGSLMISSTKRGHYKIPWDHKHWTPMKPRCIQNLHALLPSTARIHKDHDWLQIETDQFLMVHLVNVPPYLRYNTLAWGTGILQCTSHVFYNTQFAFNFYLDMRKRHLVVWKNPV